jgi:hypothetical protein
LPIGFGASEKTGCVRCGKTQSFPATLKFGRVVCGTCLRSLIDDDDDDDDDDNDEEDDNDDDDDEEEEAEQQNSNQFEAAVYAVTTSVFL